MTAISKMDIVLFETSKEGASCSQLKHFINFLNFCHIKRPIKFTYASENGDLLRQLGLGENLLLETNNNGKSCQERENIISSLINDSGNINLLRLTSNISDYKSFPDQVDQETRKIIALVKTLITPAEYIFLDSPEKYLGVENLKLLTAALEYQVKAFGQIVLINSPNMEYWEKIAIKIVSTQQSCKEMYKIRFTNSSKVVSKFLDPNPVKEDCLIFSGVDPNEKVA